MTTVSPTRAVTASTVPVSCMFSHVHHGALVYVFWFAGSQILRCPPSFGKKKSRSLSGIMKPGSAMAYLLLCWLHSRVYRSEEHMSELQSLRHLVCRLLLEKKKKVDRNLLQPLLTDVLCAVVLLSPAQ